MLADQSILQEVVPCSALSFLDNQKRIVQMGLYLCSFYTGTQNNNGLCVFDCVPCKGELKTGSKQEIQVTFKPDHESRHFSDAARIILFNTVSRTEG